MRTCACAKCGMNTARSTNKPKFVRVMTLCATIIARKKVAQMQPVNYQGPSLVNYLKLIDRHCRGRAELPGASCAIPNRSFYPPVAGAAALFFRPQEAGGVSLPRIHVEAAEDGQTAAPALAQGAADFVAVAVFAAVSVRAYCGER